MDVDFRNQETEVLKIEYSFKQRSLNGLKAIGKTYKGVFGNSYKPL